MAAISSNTLSSSNDVKGQLGESEVNKMLVKLFKHTKFYLFSDIIIPLTDDSTQIDHVVISKYGVFVIETKNYSGWIYGTEKSSTWTQVIYKKKYQFQNPLHQNYKHLKVLEAILSLKEHELTSIVVFADKCEFKTEMPKNVTKVSCLHMTLGNYVKNAFDDEQIDELANKMRSAYVPGTSFNRNKHNSNVAKNLFNNGKMSNHG